MEQQHKYLVLGRAAGKARITLLFNDRNSAVRIAKEVAALPGQSPVAVIEARNTTDAVTFYFANGEEVQSQSLQKPLSRRRG